MNKTFLLFCFSISILVFSFIVICISPIINNIQIGNWSFSKWRALNCQILADKENSDTVSLDEIQKFKKMKNLCYRKKAMHDLEYAALIIDLVLGFICANLSLLHYLNVGKDFEKKTGLIGFITGIIGFIITFVYFCYNAYIFDNDIAFSEIDYDDFSIVNGVKKLYSNGATYKSDGTKYITPFANEKDDYSEFIKYKELGQKQYNYDSDLYKSSTKADSEYRNCQRNSISNIYNKEDYATVGTKKCDYIWKVQTSFVYNSIENKYIYNRCITTFILNIFILISSIGLILFGFFLFRSLGEINQVGVPIPMSSVNVLDNKQE